MKVPPTRWWHPEPRGDRIVCYLCPRECKLQDGQRGFCFVRQNVGGEMLLTTYGRSTGFCIDPIEKKPLNHFLPGTPILSFGTAGCNLGCKFCQNWDISKSREVEILSQEATPEAIRQAAVDHGCRSIAYTYNDPVIWAEYVIDTARVAREAGLKNIAVTAGYITPEARGEFYQYIDAVNVDLKAFSDAFYRSLTLANLQPVLETLKWLKAETDVWIEVTNLMIPGENDGDDEVRGMCDWMLENVGNEVPIHFTAFHPDFKMRDKPPTPPETISRAREIAMEVGVRYAYVGNVLNLAEQSTYCPGCGEVLIERDHYTLGKFHLHDGQCLSCGFEISGVFEDERGSWGRKRLPISIPSDQDHRGSNGQSGNPGADLKMALVKTEFEPEEEQAMLTFARSVVDAAVLGNEPRGELPRELALTPGFGMFVTLRRGQMLRACIGNWGESGAKTIGELLRFSASASATNDHRFPSIHPRDLPLLTVEISLMYDPKQVTGEGAERANSVEVGEHGLVITLGDRRGLLLPQVATENGWDESGFLEQVCAKAGLAPDAWQMADSKLMTFRGRHFVSRPSQSDLELADVAASQLQTLPEISDALLSNAPRQFQLSASLTQPSPSPLGVVVETQNGLQATALRSGVSIPDLLKMTAANLVQIARKQGKEIQPTKRILVLSHAISL
ncbi:MAG: AmmeMemoRadiSam system radical SAM enzyme, partial [Verrucomicrobiota bacterium]